MNLTDAERRTMTQRRQASAKSTKLAQTRPSETFDWDRALEGAKAILEAHSA